MGRLLEAGQRWRSRRKKDDKSELGFVAFFSIMAQPRKLRRATPRWRRCILLSPKRQHDVVELILKCMEDEASLLDPRDSCGRISSLLPL